MKRLIVVLFVASCLQVCAKDNPKGAQDAGNNVTQTNTLRRVHVFVSGTVQNVGFRNFVKAKASKLTLTGWVKNLADKRVELIVEGPNSQIEELLKSVAKGPPAAKVTDVEQTDEAYKGEFKTFEKIVGADD